MSFEGTGFGWVIFKGKRFETDIYVVNDRAIERNKSIPYEKFGTGHFICKEELESFLPKECEILIIGTGQYGVCKLTKDGEQFLKERGIKVILKPTPQAITEYNKLKTVHKDLCALIHVTC